MRETPDQFIDRLYAAKAVDRREIEARLRELERKTALLKAAVLAHLAKKHD
jgi:hypothetical protein